MPNFSLLIQDPKAKITLSSTRFGGLPAVPSGAGLKWPACKGCKKPLRFMGQLRTDEPVAVVSLFLCGEGCDSYDPSLGASAAFVFPAKGLVKQPAPPKWKGKTEREYGVRLETVKAPDYFEAHQSWDRDHEGEAAVGQWGGKPKWLQNPEVPKCSACKKKMEFVAQLISGGAFESKAMDFGDGDAYVFRCKCGSGSAKLCWQCY